MDALFFLKSQYLITYFITQFRLPIPLYKWIHKNYLYFYFYGLSLSTLLKPYVLCQRKLLVLKYSTKYFGTALVQSTLKHHIIRSNVCPHLDIGHPREKVDKAKRHPVYIRSHAIVVIKLRVYISNTGKHLVLVRLGAHKTEVATNTSCGL